jgi:hypothetical protein
MRPQAIEKEEFVAIRYVSLLLLLVHERTQVPLLASFLLSIELLAWIRLVLVGVIEPLESCVRQLA